MVVGHISSTVDLRLSSDALQLDARLAPDLEAIPRAALFALIEEKCAQLGITLSAGSLDLPALLRTYTWGDWITLLRGVRPVAPTDGRLELVVPIPVADARGLVRNRRQAVRAGTVLACRQAGVAGVQGLDLLGRAIVPRAPREVRLPQGHNTEVIEDGMLLRASCDGEVLLRNLVIEVVPMYVHAGDLPQGTQLVLGETSVFITGSVGARAGIAADGEIYIQGDVFEADVRSRSSSVTVLGGVSGSSQRSTVLHAAKDIVCGAVSHAVLSAGGDIRLRTNAWHSRLKAENVYLPRSLEHSLVDVQLQVEGAVLPTLEQESYYVPVAQDRQHVRFWAHLRASIALHGTPPLSFRTCTILDLSTGGARCRLPQDMPEPAPGAIVQLKFTLPGSRDQVIAIARVRRQIRPGVVGIAFLQMSQEDQHRLTTLSLQRVLNRAQGELASRDRRKGNDPS